MTARHRLGLLAGLLLPLAVVLAGVIGAQPAAASTLTARQSSPQPLSCFTAVIVVTAVVVDVQPENRVKAISLDAGTRVSESALDSPARIRETVAVFTTIVVRDLLVNLSDPTGHRYTTGDDYVDANSGTFCQTCYTYPTQYRDESSQGKPTVSSALSMRADRFGAVAHDVALQYWAEWFSGKVNSRGFADASSRPSTSLTCESPISPKQLIAEESAGVINIYNPDADGGRCGQEPGYAPVPVEPWLGLVSGGVFVTGPFLAAACVEVCPALAIAAGAASAPAAAAGSGVLNEIGNESPAIGENSSGLIDVSQSALDRALLRLQNLSVGGQPVVNSVQAFGSRAGSTFSGPPTAQSDLDLLLETDQYLTQGRSASWIKDALDSIAADYETEAGHPLDLRAPYNVDWFKSGIQGSPWITLFTR